MYEEALSKRTEMSELRTGNRVEERTATSKTMRELIDEVQCDSNGYIRLKLKGELVRCGECEHKREQKNGQKYCGLHGSHYAMIVTGDWFCADGERKEKTHE